MKRTAATFLACLLASPALSHSQLEMAVPADGATVSSPAEIDLTFSEGINPAFSAMTLIGPDQSVVGIGKPQLKDEGKTLTVDIAAPLAAGSYRVDWQVLSNDGHKTKGSISFIVKP